MKKMRENKKKGETQDTEERRCVFKNQRLNKRKNTGRRQQKEDRRNRQLEEMTLVAFSLLC